MAQAQGSSHSTPSANGHDPRLYQIASLGALLMYGLFWLHFDISLWQIAVTIGTALFTQYLGTRLAKLPYFDPKSAFISSSRSACSSAPITSPLRHWLHSLPSAASSSFVGITSISSIQRISPLPS